MTRKRAIEAAIKANKMPPIAGASRTPTYDTFGIAEKAYEAGKIAGLREAARIMAKRDQWLPTGAQAEIRDLAKALSKKARGK